MEPHKYLDLLLEGKLVATPHVEPHIAFFIGIPNTLLNIAREIDIKHGLKPSNVKGFVAEIVQKLGFIKKVDGESKADYSNMNIIKDSNIKELAAFIHDSPFYFTSRETPEMNEVEAIIRKHLPEKYRLSQPNLFPNDLEK